MIKNLTLLLLSLLFLQGVRAQKQGTTIYYLKNSGQVVPTKDSADYTLFIISPDKSANSNINTLKAYYNNGHLKLTATAAGNPSDIRSLVLSGPMNNYYPNGNPRNIINNQNGKQVGELDQYYPNGQLYDIEKHDKSDNMLLVECHDSTGNILAKGGNGNWVMYTDNYKNKVYEGPVKDSVQEGIWHIFVNDSAKYTILYHNGNVSYTTEPDNPNTPKDTLTYYFKNPAQPVSSKKSADYYRQIINHDRKVDKQLIPVKEFYIDGKPKLVAFISFVPKTILIFEGPSESFYPNGKLKYETSLNGLIPLRTQKSYYPNGQLYEVITGRDESDIFTNPTDPLLIECRDTTGKILAENGNGNWINFDENFKNIIEEGSVDSGLRVGKWKGEIPSIGSYECLYVKGKPTIGTGYDMNGIAHPFTNFLVKAEFPGGEEALSKFLKNEISYPNIDRRNNVQGVVLVNFIIDQKGNVTNIKVLGGPSGSLIAEAVRVIKLSSPWKPQLQCGLLVPAVFTIPINFHLGSNYNITPDTQNSLPTGSRFGY